MGVPINLYLDMDGVMCDFYKEIAKYDPEIPLYKEREEKYPSEKWEDIFNQFIDDKGFAFLKPFDIAINDFMPEEIRSLKEENVSTCFLSSAGNSPRAYEIYKQKRKWLDLWGFDEVPLILVKHKGYKKDFASCTSILVDDTLQNIKDFSERGGGVVHIEKGLTMTDITIILDKIRDIQRDFHLYGVGTND